MADVGAKISRGPSVIRLRQAVMGPMAVAALSGVALLVGAQKLPFVFFLLLGAYLVGASSHRLRAATGSATAPESSADDREEAGKSVLAPVSTAVGDAKAELLVKRNQELTVLHSLATAVGSSLELSEVLSLALREVIGACRAGAGEIVVTGAPNEAVVMYCRGEEVIAAYRGRTAPRLNRRLASQVAKSGEPLIKSVNEEPSIVDDRMRRAGVTYLVILPIKIKERVLGTIALACSPRFDIASVDQELLMSIGSMIGAAIENSQLYRRLKHISDTDAVTGLYNRRFIMKRLGSELKRAARYSHELSVLLLDVDNFKTLNDTYGHPFGDLALKKVALAATAACRQTDFVGRYGGDEFLLVLPETQSRVAGVVGDRIKKYVSSINLSPGPAEHGPVVMTASIGQAVYPGTARSGADLLVAADKNLYVSKRAGSPFQPL